MGGRYYCDYCDCTFPDNAANRKNHMDGSVHQQNKRMYYAENRKSRTKPPCKQFMQNQFCEYGPNCRYSHIMFDRFTGQPILPTQTIPASKPQPSVRYELPKGWKARELTPSLKPPPRKGYDWTQVGHWG
ncbi:hypothetical protein K450DRAFT_238722 [Umbelopsis ramanniana AG]|uniref:C3H1-type domain-containing protein n=1 Tax=Umbelopsis ramanniana AG TaxID=1314678 RepID=A0AAD5EA82_UMBRA|nr:uncharacterized protein K450DRAFT_238722 [Umbelopsis ramanniana AG]KAI8580221.1 hypothetical protein K450DRAFT_238722 [Umbelopsis ramanniana AG]